MNREKFLELLKRRLEANGLEVERLEVVEGSGIWVFLGDGSAYAIPVVRQPDGTHRLERPYCVAQAVRA